MRRLRDICVFDLIIILFAVGLGHGHVDPFYDPPEKSSISDSKIVDQHLQRSAANPPFIMVAAIGSESARDRAMSENKGSPSTWSTVSKAFDNRKSFPKGGGPYDHYSKVMDVLPKSAISYLNLGNFYARKGKLNNAISNYSKAIEMDPEIIEAYTHRGMVYMDTGKSDLAIHDFTRAIDLKPMDRHLYFNRGIIYLSKAEYDLAISDYSRAIEIDPAHPDTYYHRGFALKHKGQYGPAIADYAKAIELSPSHPLYYNNLAWVLATCPDGSFRDGERAVYLAEQALELEETDAFMDTLAAAYAEIGDFQKAIKTATKAIALVQKEGETEILSEYKRHLESFKAGKPWRE